MRGRPFAPPLHELLRDPSSWGDLDDYEIRAVLDCDIGALRAYLQGREDARRATAVARVEAWR